MKRLWFALAIALSAHMVLLYFLPSLLVKRPDPAKPETKSNIRSVMITMSYRAPEILKKAEPEKEPVVRPVEKKAVPPEKTQKIPSPILKKEEKIGPQVVQKKPALPLKKTVKQKKEPPKHATEIKPPKKTLPPPPEPEQLLPTKPQTEKTQPQKTLPEPPRPAPPEPPQTMVQDPKVKEDIPLNTTPKASEKTILPLVKKSQKTVDNPIQTIQTTDPEYRNNPSPSYPKIARKRGYEGLVELLVLISIDGQPSQIKIQTSTGHKVLDQQAVKTIKRWKFTPRRDNGIPIETWVMVPIRFKLY
jgi:protein TonB